MNYTKSTILFIILISIFSIPVNAEVINGGFETGDFTGWTKIGANPAMGIFGPGTYTHSGSYGLRIMQMFAGTCGVQQSIDCSNYNNLSFWYKNTDQGSGYGVLKVYIDDDLKHSLGGSSWINYHLDISNYSGSHVIKFMSSASNMCVAFDDVELSDYESSITLMEFTNEPIEVTTYAHLECNLDDYWDTHANEHFYLSYDYYYKNVSDYTIIDYNELELNSQNTVTFIPTYYPYFNQTGGCEIKASILYTYNDPVYTESPLGFITTVLINSTYEPPEEPEELEEPEIPDPEPEPDPEPDPPIPPTQPNGTGANQSINVSWTGEYYNAVNNTFDGLCSPIYNFTNWSLSPIYSLNDSIGKFNYYMNESFTQTAQDSSILYDSINTIYSAIHPKIRNVITYYLIWVVLLIILKKD